ncbi:hypothetical protein MMC14_003484 [Varicellaria rhodocarpa]|nr:hypothetical protein [Varicellaria rhodocarpa]
MQEETKATETNRPITSPVGEEPWPPITPDVIWEEIVYEEMHNLGSGGSSIVCEIKDSAFKIRATQREYDMMKIAGECSVKVVERVISIDKGSPTMRGLVTELQIKLDIKKVKPSERAALKDEIIRLVITLQETQRMVHGDVKPSNMLICKDGKLRFCDFEVARSLDEDPLSRWGFVSPEYTSPNRRCYHVLKAPTPSDDIYALGIGIWEIYTGMKAFPLERLQKHMREILREKRTMELMDIEDQDVRAFVRRCLVQGGAIV